MLAHLVGIDPRHGGSGNIGATNVARTAGKKLGAATLMLDVAKGALPVLLARYVANGAAADPSLAEDLAVTAALGAVAGHVFSIALRFHGGKGVATGFGATVVLTPLGALVATLSFIAVFVAFRRVSVASIVAAGVVPVGAALAGCSTRTVLALLAIAFLIIFRHGDNIRRILSGTEPRFSSAEAAGGGEEEAG
jgi:glycerol-3-phosphate acyltransferase PlsY